MSTNPFMQTVITNRISLPLRIKVVGKFRIFFTFVVGILVFLKFCFRGGVLSFFIGGARQVIFNPLTQIFNMFIGKFSTDRSDVMAGARTEKSSFGAIRENYKCFFAGFAMFRNHKFILS